MTEARAKRRVLLIDDDPVLLGLLSYKLKRHCPELEVTTSTLAEAAPGHDIYVIDNDFGGAHSGARLAERVRLIAPDALILVFSSFLDVPLLKRVANIGADGVFDKREESDIERLLSVIALHSEAPVPARAGQSSILRDLWSLLSAWNRKLAREERARAAS